MEPRADVDPLERLSELNQIDRHFARLIGRLSGEQPELKLAAALVSLARRLGHICLDLRALDNGESNGLLANLEGFAWPEKAKWLESLRASPAVGQPGEFKPLILDPGGRLYLHRYWKYESELAAFLKRQASEPAPAIDPEVLAGGIARLFPRRSPAEVDWQMVAVYAALRRRLCVISGGPGTGKTRTVVVLLALLLEQDQNLRIGLAAPTGKAAARLQEAVKEMKASLPCPPEIRDKLPDDASTLHRLLEFKPGSAFFRRDAKNPLALDVVVVDEASMVDLALMAKLASALPASSRLILLGDKDQLASIEAGAVLADICGDGEHRHFSEMFRSECAAATSCELPRGKAPAALADCIVELQKNYRFGEESAIHQLGQAVRDGDSDRAIGVLERATAKSAPDLVARRLPTPAALKDALRETVLENFAPVLEAKEPAETLRLLGEFRILSALRHGPYGVENINRLAQELLIEAGLISSGALEASGPLIITRNDYNLRLFNGDIGILLPDLLSMQPRAWFAATDGTLRSHLPLRLPTHKPAYALTVHKSQGSEFKRTLLILPAENSPVLSRELIYTGLTRASRRVELWHNELLLPRVIQRQTIRRSGLRDALWATPAA
jgi:exodeoxyribonuclease V alpha subunit